MQSEVQEKVRVLLQPVLARIAALEQQTHLLRQELNALKPKKLPTTHKQEQSSKEKKPIKDTKPRPVTGIPPKGKEEKKLSPKHELIDQKKEEGDSNAIKQNKIIPQVVKPVVKKPAPEKNGNNSADNIEQTLATKPLPSTRVKPSLHQKPPVNGKAVEENEKKPIKKPTFTSPKVQKKEESKPVDGNEKGAGKKIEKPSSKQEAGKDKSIKPQKANQLHEEAIVKEEEIIAKKEETIVQKEEQSVEDETKAEKLQTDKVEEKTEEAENKVEQEGEINGASVNEQPNATQV